MSQILSSPTSFNHSNVLVKSQFHKSKKAQSSFSPLFQRNPLSASKALNLEEPRYLLMLGKPRKSIFCQPLNFLPEKKASMFLLAAPTQLEMYVGLKSLAINQCSKPFQLLARA